VKAKWYKLVQTSQRAYVVLPDEDFMLNVNAMVRLPEPVTFEAVKARKKPVIVVTAAANRPQRTTAAGTPALSPAPLLVPPREKPHFLGEPKHNEILASLADVRL
jgi:hypothetical protein